MMIEQRRALSVGLPKKKEENDLDEYKNMSNGDWPGLEEIQPMGKESVDNFVKFKINLMEQNPELYFNFGFTYNDFKAYILKLSYCRAMRKFIERKRLEKIADFQRNNNFEIGDFGYENNADDYNQNNNQ